MPNESENEIEKKIRTGLAPFFVGTKRLGQLTPIRVYLIYTWARDILTLAAGLGLSHPIFAYLAGPTQGAFKDVATVNPSLAWGAAMVLLVLGIVGLYLKRTNAESHATLVTVYARQAQKFRAKLRVILSKADPMPELLLLETEIQSALNRSMDEGVWTWEDIYPVEFQPDVGRIVAELSREFKANWTAVPSDGEQREARRSA